MFCALLGKYQVSVYRTIGPLVFLNPCKHVPCMSMYDLFAVFLDHFIMI